MDLRLSLAALSLQGAALLAFVIVLSVRGATVRALGRAPVLSRSERRAVDRHVRRGEVPRGAAQRSAAIDAALSVRFEAWMAVPWMLLACSFLVRAVEWRDDRLALLPVVAALGLATLSVRLLRAAARAASVLTRLGAVTTPGTAPTPGAR